MLYLTQAYCQPEAGLNPHRAVVVKHVYLGHAQPLVIHHPFPQVLFLVLHYSTYSNVAMRPPSRPQPPTLICIDHFLPMQAMVHKGSCVAVLGAGVQDMIVVWVGLPGQR